MATNDLTKVPPERSLESELSGLDNLEMVLSNVHFLHITHRVANEVMSAFPTLLYTIPNSFKYRFIC